MISLASVLVVLVPVVLLALAQVILRWQARSFGGVDLDAFAYFKAIATSWWLWAALVLAGIALLFWLGILRRHSLSYVYPFVSLTFPIVGVLSILMLGERLSTGQVIGLGFIVLGVALNAYYGA